MVSKSEDPAAWAMIVQDLEDAAEHLHSLVRALEAEPEYGDPEFRVDLGHVYAHLNRAWNRREAKGEAAAEPTDEQFEAWSQFPDDVYPVG